MVQRAAVMAVETPIHSENLKLVLGKGAQVVAISDRDTIRPLKEMEREHVNRALAAKSWNIKAASEALGISRVTLYKKIKDYGQQRV